jgi:hypothetical protein
MHKKISSFIALKNKKVLGRINRLLSFQYSARFSIPNSVQTGSGAHPASYPIGTGGSFPRVKVAGV